MPSQYSGFSVVLVALLSLGHAASAAQPSTVQQTEDGQSESEHHPASATAQPAPSAAAEPVWRQADGGPLPLRTAAEIREFLRTARIVDSKKTKHGRFGVRKLRLEQDGIAIHAACRTFAEEKQSVRLQGRQVSFFRDHYIHEPAAYALSKLLGLDMVPPAVERKVLGKGSSVQIWVEGAMAAVERSERNIQPPDPESCLLQLAQMRVFDNLINNIDRNQGNILWDSEWRIWLIDHTRAFMRDRRLPDPDGLGRLERGFWERLRSVSDAELQAAIAPYLGKPEREALLARRRLLVELIEAKIALVGEDKVLFSRDRIAPRPPV